MTARQISSTSLVQGMSLLGTNRVDHQEGDIDLDAQIAAAQANIERLQQSLQNAGVSGTVGDVPEAPETGDVIIANGEGPPQVAGNSVKPPVALETPQSKVQRTTSQLSMLAAPTVVVSDSATPPTPLLNDAQSQQFSPPVPTPPRLGDAKVASTPSGNLGPTVREKPKKPAPCYNSKYDKYYHQLRRYVTPREDGSMVASKETSELFKTEEGRKKLKDLLIKEGSLAAMDVVVKKTHQRSLDESKGGGWMTKHYLQSEKHWTKQMCDNAWAWAKEHSLWRVNPVHKEEECKLVVDDEFKYNVHQSHSSEQSGAFEMQDPECTLLDDNDVPDGLSKLVPNLDADGEGGKPQEASSSTHGSFKLVFPTLQQNTSVMAILPTFLDTLGRKIESAEREKEKQSARDFDRAQQYAASIGESVTQLNQLYDQLTKLQGEAYTTKEGTKEFNDKTIEITNKMKEITKADIALNNLVVRAKNLKAPAKKALVPPVKRPAPGEGTPAPKTKARAKAKSKAKSAKSKAKK